MNQKPRFKTNKAAHEYFSEKLDLILKKWGMTRTEAVIKADSANPMTEEDHEVMSLNMSLNTLEHIMKQGYK